jgi:beta-N-acetylhexosaminidase
MACDDQNPLTSSRTTPMPRQPSPRLKTIARYAVMSIFAAVLLGGCIAAVDVFLTQQRRQKVMHTPIAQARVLGARFIVGYDDPDVVIQLARRGLIAGVFVTQRNAKNKSVEVLRQEIAQMQAVRQAAGLPQLIVATDQEGGAVSRLSPPLAQQAALSSLLVPGAAARSPEAQAFDYGVEQGQALAYVGVNLNFSPVVDIKSQRAISPFDLFSRINNRAISGDPEVVARVASAYSRGLASAGVFATAKHFPGLGEVAADTHFFSAQLDTPVDVLRQRDWLPFRQVIVQTDALMMLGHVTLPSLDPAYPASLSRKVVQGVIRQAWGHDGVLITDDLTMRAAQNLGTCKATLAALNAGVDLLLVSYAYDEFYEAMQCAVDALNAGQLDPALLASSGERLAQFNRRRVAATTSPAPRLQPH